MPKRELPAVSRALTDAAMTLCRGTADYEAMKDQLRFAAIGAEAHIREATFYQGKPEAVHQLKAADKECREVEHWLSVLARNGMVKAGEAESVMLLCGTLRRCLSGGIREREARLAEKEGRSQRREMSFSTSRLLIQRVSGRLAVSLPTFLEKDEMAAMALVCRNREEAQEQINRWQTGDEMLAITRQSDGRFIGLVGLMQEASPHARRVTVAITPDARLCGYATEALRGALAYGFHKLGMTVAVARVRQEEAVIRKILRHIGFSEDGVLRRGFADGADQLCLSLLKEEWQRNL